MPSIATLAGPWAEPLVFLAMVATFGILAVSVRWPVGVALLAAAWLGAALAGDYVPLRHLVEGAFSYLDPILVIATASIFMRVLADGGALDAIGENVERRFRRWPVLLVPVLMVIVMFPGMITGSSTASVLTTGAMAAPILMRLGLRAERAGAFVAMGGILGMVAPPVNIPVMLIGGGLDLPYVGFAAPLAILSFPLALVVAYALASPLLRPRHDAGVLAGDNAAMRIAPGGVAVAVPPARPATAIAMWRAVVPIAVVAALMAVPQVSPQYFPDPGLPLVFLISAAVGIMCSRRFPVRATLVTSIEQALPVLGILTGVGAFIQVLTLTGARGWLVALMLGVPSWALIMTAAAGIPLFGAVSTFGSASVLGVPYLLALLGRNEIVTASALSLLAGLGDLMLPASVAPTLAARVAGVDNRLRVLAWCLLPALAAIVVAVLVLFVAPDLGRWLKGR